MHASIYAPNGRQRIALAGLVPTHPATILAPRGLMCRICQKEVY